ncbi:hypothetical protein [Variovorax sp.]|uniref:hypothetical protein n=1 Tax=Variovorax sp. TaxID=1871043 RepID=UPI0025E4CD73|nr:hypothetical protein [Variovorax sp.]
MRVIEVAAQVSNTDQTNTPRARKACTQPSKSTSRTPPASALSTPTAPRTSRARKFSASPSGSW